jgi:hypothetical protein
MGQEQPSEELLGWLMAHSLNVVSVGIKYKCAIIVSVIVRSKPWLAVVTTASCNCRLVKGVYGFPVWSGECNMASRPDGVSQANPKERCSVCSVSGEVLTFGIQSLDIKAMKRLVKERLGSRHVANGNCYVI